MLDNLDAAGVERSPEIHVEGVGVGITADARDGDAHRVCGPGRVVGDDGAVCVTPDLPFGGDNCNAIKASGIFQPRENRLWLPVSTYLIEHPKGLFLVDTGWARAMSPEGVFDKHAQVKSLGSLVLYEVNQGQVPLGECVDEQLAVHGRQTDYFTVFATPFQTSLLQCSTVG